MVKINNQLKEKLQREIPIATLFEYTTVRDLALYLAGDGGAGGSEGGGEGATRAEEQAAAQSRRTERAQARLASRQRRQT